jgi:threonine dehydrogenase-like Zn-dependent dehydrogenase
MKALVWHGGQVLRLEDVSEPEPAADEVVVEVGLAGICGSDLHAYRGHSGPRIPPLILGHEVIGRLDGSDYAVYPLVSCGACGHCAAGADNLCGSWQLLGIHRPGVFAERVAVPQRCLLPVPLGVNAERLVLAEPLACSVGALRPHRLGESDRVVVFGCGPIGLLTVYVAALSGAEVIAVDPVAQRRAYAEHAGAARAVTAIQELDRGSADLVVDAAGFETTWQAAIDAVRSGGVIVMLGLGQAAGSFPMAALVRRSITVRGQFAYSRTDFAEALEIIRRSDDRDFDWVTATPLDAGADAFANLVERPAEYLKVLLRP